MPDRSALRPMAERAARAATSRAGLLTAPVRMTPSFLICGAQRCGTTSMYQALRTHPNVLRPVLHKGVHYFDTNYPRGLNWYRAHFPLTFTAQRARKRTGSDVVTFESSPYYLFHPLAAQRIASDLPDARIIVLLRDPVERAYSAFTHEKARGFETESFERALELEPSRLAGEEQKIIADPTYNSHAHQHNAYVTRGHYIDQIERLHATIGAEKVHVVDAEDFFTDPLPVWTEVVDFLGLPSATPPPFEKHNARPRAPMADSLRTSLEDGYVASDERLAAWWGRTPSWRR